MKMFVKELRLASSKLKKYNHVTEEYYYEEDPSQAERIGQITQVSYTKEGDTYQLHSLEGPAVDKSYYINGIKYTKLQLNDYVRLMKKEETLKNN